MSPSQHIYIAGMAVWCSKSEGSILSGDGASKIQYSSFVACCQSLGKTVGPHTGRRGSNAPGIATMDKNIWRYFKGTFETKSVSNLQQNYIYILYLKYGLKFQL